MTSRYKRPRVTLGLDEGVKQDIEEMARKEHRTLAILLEIMIMESYERRKQPQPTPQPQPQENPKFLDGHDFLKIMASGRRPTDAEITEIAHSEDVDPDVLIEIRDRKFPTTSHYKQPNGNPCSS